MKPGASLVALSFVLTAACASPRAGASSFEPASAEAVYVPLGNPTQPEWTLARARLASLRASEPRRPYTEVVKVTLHEPRSGRTFEARGAVAVLPGKAMRMVLVGPGGATALDAWTTPDRWRLAIPALGRVSRGGAGSGETSHTGGATPALPVGFFRWWFLAPFEGRLLTSRARPDATLYVLRQGEDTISLLERPAEGPTLTLLASRRDGARAEQPGPRGSTVVDRLSWSGHRGAPGAGDSAFYEQPATGLTVKVVVESLSDEAPDPAAFLDPDAAGGSP